MNTTSRLRCRCGVTIFVTADGETVPDAPGVTPEMVQQAEEEHDALLVWLSGDDSGDDVGGGAQLLTGSSQDRTARFAFSPAGFGPPGEGETRPEPVSQLSAAPAPPSG